MTATAFDFYLPSELNASHPPERRGIRRDHVRMMVLDKKTGNVSHDKFFRLADYLKSGDLVVMNNSRTVPAILKAGLYRNSKLLEKEAEIRLARRRNEETWDVLIVTDRVKLGDILQFSSDLSAVVIDMKEGSPLKTILFSKKGTDLFNSIYALGEPVRYEYINHPWGLDYYQTVFASHPGSVEMPSAGRAFSWELLFNLQRKGIELDFIQLHTGLSYLLDDEVETSPTDNYEEYHLSEKTIEKIHKTKAAGGRVIAVGTTVVRALESAGVTGELHGVTNLYINQNFPLKMVDGIITGFHEPKASHLDMLTAFVPQDLLWSAYEEAIDQQYLWHEFGDMNLIL
ncbi:S-adenosylmethionine:tRNA ribosyltransferase-isomerase [Neobacillus sp. CF12]|uniref:S-adenosylmethionine:tRNA ribosyltransferase-isomerase n=1 Tax=Neobacillus sp. CF12 TaxID=3055864 RepID=UPI0025A0300F|nr:S-adenosylmethionine:tRNA ribosyltransferase-isomerase [Neobacillus sp. CF12]MDM5330873.1 S-adenosylmethionine:tRNA ribosyltransferase-isomerase [Neobacillus sp. CF12]